MSGLPYSFAPQCVSTPRELPEIKSRTNDGPEFGRDLSRVRDKSSSNLASTLRDCRPTIAAPTPHPRNSEARQDYWDGRIPNVTRDVIVQIVDQLPHSIRYLQ
ncbi:hypothetical protein H9Q73_004763 [Fusarium xylarioides]|nr:hypothetical protein H9Q73_004763 [Fusarium xylarioides]